MKHGFADQPHGGMGVSERFYTLDRDLEYYSPGLKRAFTVPAGFKCDLASIPKAFRSLALNFNVSAAPGILHDWLYRTGRVSRATADRIYREALLLQTRAWIKARPLSKRRWVAWLQSKVRPLSLARPYVQWAAVRVGASRPYEEYRRLAQGPGEPSG